MLNKFKEKIKIIMRGEPDLKKLQKIGNDVFVGRNAIVLPNVTIGDGCIIGAGAVVTKDIAAYTVAAGNPAHVLYSVQDYLNKNKKIMEYAPIFEEDYTERSRKLTMTKKIEMISSLKQYGIGYIK